MLSLYYDSSATEPFSDAALVKLLMRCRAKNTALDVTGMLLYKEGSFAQVLEGPEDAVHLLYKTILVDPRHHRAIQLLHQTVEVRSFPDWAMGFRNFNDPTGRDLPGYSEFMNPVSSTQIMQEDPSAPQRLLSLFRRAMGR